MRRADLVTLGGIAVASGLHLRFCLLDERAPTDLGHYYNPFRNLLVAWQRSGAIDAGLVDTPYSLLLAALGAVVAPSAAFMEVVDGLWLLLLFGGTALAARAAAGPIRGPIAGAIATLALLAYPQTHVLARTHWIHHPEAAALAGALGLWLSAPSLPGWGRAVGVAALLFLGETIRQTGVPFGVPLGLLVLAGAWRLGARATLVPVALGVLGGLAWHLPALPTYIANKAHSAAGYAQSVEAPWYAIVDGLGLPTLVWAVPLALFGIGALREGGVVTKAAVGMSLVWIAGGVAAVAVFNVGPDNFPIAGVALALLAGVGAAALPRRAAVASVAVGSVAVALLQVPPLLSHSLLGRWPLPLHDSAYPGPLNHLRVYWNPVTVASVLPAVDEVCGVTRADPQARCFVLATRGLFTPSWEDGGTFALFLAGRPRVTVLTPEVLWNDQGRASGVAARIHGIVDVRCAEGVAPSAGGRFARQSERMQATLQAHGSAPIATFGDSRACVQTWYSLADDGGVLVR